MRAHAVALLMIALIPTQCDTAGKKDVGGDNNPHTGECTLSFDETVGGEHHVYPFLANDDLRLVVGKVIFYCQRAPSAHRATAFLDKRPTGAGAKWVRVSEESMTRIPNPKDSIFLRGTCTFGETAYWRVRVEVTGTGVGPDGKPRPFEVADKSTEQRIVCRERR